MIASIGVILFIIGTIGAEANKNVFGKIIGFWGDVFCAIWFVGMVVILTSAIIWLWKNVP